MTRIDAHHHLWTISRGDYFWMDDSVAPIRKDFGPDDLTPLRAAHGVGGTVVVQAADTVAETEFLLALADANPSILGVVGWVDLTAPDAAVDLKRLSQHSRFKSVRPMLQDIADSNWILHDRVVENLGVAAQLGLRMDALITPRHLDAIDQLARTLPQLPIVIDHCAKPVIAGGQDAGQQWRDGMAKLAAHPQVMCKLSGLANEYGDGWSATALHDVFSHVLGLFGPHRLMWGSDWPVLNLAGDYAAWFDAAQALCADLNPADKAAIFGETAAAFYGLSVD